MKDSIIKTVPAAEALRKVPQFNPLRYLRQTTSRKTGEPVLKLDLRFKKMWFRLACSDGRMVLNPMRITDTMAIFEAQVYLHRDDSRPITNFISTMYAKNVPAGVRDFIEMKSGNAPQAPAPRPKKAKPSLPSAVGADTKPEVNSNE